MTLNWSPAGIPNWDTSGSVSTTPVSKCPMNGSNREPNTPCNAYPTAAPCWHIATWASTGGQVWGSPSCSPWAGTRSTLLSSSTAGGRRPISATPKTPWTGGYAKTRPTGPNVTGASSRERNGAAKTSPISPKWPAPCAERTAGRRSHGSFSTMVWVPTIESRMKPLVQLPRSIAVAIATAMVFVLASCGGNDDAGGKTSPTPSESSETQPSQTPEGDDELPSWANEVTKPGDKLTSLKLKDLTVDIYQVGVAEANTVGNVMNPETGKPIIDKGDDIVYVNYVITNTGPPVDLGSVLVKFEPRYKNWKFQKAMDTVTDRDQAKKMNINTSGLEAGKNTDPAIYTL